MDSKREQKGPSPPEAPAQIWLTVIILLAMDSLKASPRGDRRYPSWEELQTRIIREVDPGRDEEWGHSCISLPHCGSSHLLHLSHGRRAGWAQSASPVESGAHRPGFKSHLWNIIAVAPWTSDLTSLGGSQFPHLESGGSSHTHLTGLSVCRADERRFGSRRAENGAAWHAVSKVRVLLCN